ncbi:semaphorin-4E-like isoform X2 [Anguilla anguilla]|uniref:semaphorin-4E-like isoform X2 n=1 Tax=Anguilla anguilla TaxID=7936 RepID=UPI0015AF6FA2|nr:semaphorin-4E-like isoform X2 [Anguilla anguilla]
MSPLTPAALLWGLVLLLMLSDSGALEVGPRETVRFQEEHIRQFREEGVQNYSTMLLQEDKGLLLVGARGAVYALDLSDISSKKGSVYWEVKNADKVECTNKGKQPDTECQNYIRVLQEARDGRVYVCGTNAYSPSCAYMSSEDGQLKLDGAKEDGKGKCPFDPLQRYSSVMVDGSLYSATSNNFLGSEPVVMRSLANPVRTEFKISWLNEPSFVSMYHVPESVGSADGDDDKVYLFFSESAVEFDSYSKLTVSRVARVCKGDIGGLRTLQKKWTSFLKARLDCPVLDSRLPHVVQDVFLLRHENWRDSVFYAVFTPQEGPVGHSAVCAYNVFEIGDVFSHGKFKTPVTVATSFVKWVMYSEDLPEPRPGACIDDAARALGVKRSLDLPDKTLRFVQDQPLMDQAVEPLGGGPQLVERGAKFTRIVVDRVEALDGRTYNVMFIGTENGFLHKAVNYGGEMVVIEEVQLFQAPEPIKILRLSSGKASPQGLLYAGADSGVVQMPLSACGRHASCLDCVLSRDPYCAWDPPSSRCVALSGLGSPRSGDLIQNVTDGDASLCPNSAPDPVRANVSLVPGSNINLPCRPRSNRARVRWHLSGRPLPPSPRYSAHGEGLMVLGATPADAGTYTCLSEERVKGRQYNRTEAEYRLAPGAGGETTPRVEARVQGGSLVPLQVSVAVLALLLAGLLVWNLRRGHLPLPCGTGGGGDQAPAPAPAPAPSSDPARNCVEEKPLMSVTNYNAHNNRLTLAASNGEGTPSPKVAVDTFQYIDDESEI